MPLTPEILHWTDLQAHWLQATLAARDARRSLEKMPLIPLGLLQKNASKAQRTVVRHLELEADEAQLAADYFLRKLLATGAND